MLTRTVATVLLVVLSAGPASAARNLPEGAERVLAGHAFMPSTYLDDPFVGTTIANHVGAGVALNLPTTFSDLDGNVLYEYEGDIFFAALGLHFQQNLWTDWSAEIMVTGIARTGSNLESILSEGANVDRTLELGLQRRLLRSERAQVSLAVHWDYSNTTLFTPRAFAEHIADGGSIETAPIVVDSKVWRSRLTARAAYALSRWWGVRVNASAGAFEDPDVDGVSKGVYQFGAMVDLDLDQVQPIPVGVTLGYLFGLPENNPYTDTRGATLGVWYIGQPDFTIGAEFAFLQRAVLERPERVDGMIALLTMRYWF